MDASRLRCLHRERSQVPSRADRNRAPRRPDELAGHVYCHGDKRSSRPMHEESIAHGGADRSTSDTTRTVNRRQLLAWSGGASATALALAGAKPAAAAIVATPGFVFVEDFGAVGNGSTKDADAIQRALN